MSTQLTLLAIPNAISSPGSVAGPTPSGSQDGPMISQRGQDLVHANLSARQAKAQGLLMSGISGLPGSISSFTVALQSSLENKLKQRFVTVGLILFRLIWKGAGTPSGRRFCLLRASAHRTSEADYGLWPTPCTEEHRDTRAHNNIRAGHSLDHLAKLGSWPTVRANDAEKRGQVSDDSRNGLVTAANLTSWSSPRANKWGFPDSHGSHEQPIASWPTASARDWRDGRSNQHGKNARPLNEVADLATSGTPPSGSPAVMGSGGQLNPRLSGWLMGYPKTWDLCALRVIPIIRTRSVSSTPRLSKKVKRGS